MKTDLFTYTGTGNSLWIARELAKGLGAAQVYPLSRIPGEEMENGTDAVGIIFPVHIWGLPHPVIAALDRFAKDPLPVLLRRSRQRRPGCRHPPPVEAADAGQGLSLSSGFEIAMPSNYIPLGWSGTGGEAEGEVRAGAEKVGAIAAGGSQAGGAAGRKRSALADILLGWLYRLSFARVPLMDKSFWVDGKCNACTICKSICPAGNIVLEAGRPSGSTIANNVSPASNGVLGKPIQFGKKTPRYERYHHPDVTLQDMMAGNAFAADSRKTD